MGIANTYSAIHILQIAYFQEHIFPKIELDHEEKEIPEEVLKHFRDIKNIEAFSTPIKVSVFDNVITDRKRYLLEAKKFISSYSKERCVVFLDPDTGLEPTNNPSLKHVLNEEAKEYWESLKTGDILAVYQHKTNRNGKSWKEPKRVQFEKVIGVSRGTVKMGWSPKLANDVVLFYLLKA